MVAVIVIVVCILELTNTTHFFHKSVSTIKSTHPSSTTAASAKKSQAAKKSSSGSSSPDTSSPKNTATASPSSGNPPATPTGNFVSNHRPNLGGSPAPSQETSVCITSPGASCYIAFTQGNVVKRLDAQTADSNGAAYWTWDVNQDGFSTGTWQISAVATANGKTSTGKDALDLVVQP